jgi:heme-degrading monooxygenase HmoA
MYIRLTHFEAKPGVLATGLDGVREHLLPLLERQEGFLRVIVAGDAEGGRGVVLTFWQSAEHEARYDGSGDALRARDMFRLLLTHEPESEGFSSLLDREF